MNKWMKAGGSYQSMPLRPVDSTHDSIIAGIDQSAPSVMVLSQYGIWTFMQDNTDVVVSELRKLADMIDKNVAR